MNGELTIAGYYTLYDEGAQNKRLGCRGCGQGFNFPAEVKTINWA